MDEAIEGTTSTKRHEGCDALVNTEKDKHILVIDSSDEQCLHQYFINRKADEEGSDCLKFSSIIFLESEEYRSSSPKQNEIKGLPVLTVHTRDAKDIRRAFQEDQAVKMDSLDRMVETSNPITLK